MATGISWRRLGVPSLEALVGAGVFYGAAGSELHAMEGRHVFVVGAGNSAGQTTLHLARHARHVTMVVRGDNLSATMSDYLIREIEATANVTVRLCTQVTDGHGSPHLETLTLHDKATGQAERIPAVALFVLIGGEPRTRWLPETIQLEHGYIRTGRDVLADGARASGRAPERAPYPAGDVRARRIRGR